MLAISESAANKFKELSLNQNLQPRIEITSGGCNGFEKKFSFDAQHDNDICIKLPNGIVILVDEFTYEFLCNSTIDYVTTQVPIKVHRFPASIA